MGFWHTGYIEFHEPTGLGKLPVPTVIVFRCEVCARECATLDELRQHRFEAHPVMRPVLLIGSREVPDVGIHVTERLHEASVTVIHASRASVNGIDTPVNKLGAILSSASLDRIVVALRNEAVSATFTIDFRIASQFDLEGIEHAFMSVARGRRLDMRAVEDFIDATTSFATAARYRDGICGYLYGVLAKERSADSALHFEEYRIKFNSAVTVLADFRRPLANVIRALVAFHFNHFTLASDLVETRVGKVAAELRRLLRSPGTGFIQGTASAADARLERLLSDFQTEQILSWCTSPEPTAAVTVRLESLFKEDTTEFDRSKARILLAESYLGSGQAPLAAAHAREVINDPTFGQWAEQVVNLAREAGVK